MSVEVKLKCGCVEKQGVVIKWCKAHSRHKTDKNANKVTK